MVRNISEEPLLGPKYPGNSPFSLPGAGVANHGQGLVAPPVCSIRAAVLSQTRRRGLSWQCPGQTRQGLSPQACAGRPGTLLLLLPGCQAVNKETWTPDPLPL